MPVCEKHGRYIPTGQHCGACWSEGAFAKKVEAKVSRFTKHFPVSDNTKERQKLKARLQMIWSRKMKEYYRSIGLDHCFITGKSTMAKGIMGLHVSHYFPKGILWQLWTIPENSGLSTYDMNVNKPEAVGMMRMKLVELWGEERFKALEAKAKFHEQQIAIGAEKKHPPVEWLMAKIKELQSKSFKIQ